MARTTNKLTDIEIRRIKEPGTYGDGGGLELQVTSSGGRAWVFRFMLERKRRQMGLGGYPTVGLREARDKAEEARKLAEKGIDPIAHRNAAQAADKAAEEARRAEAERARMTFDHCAEAYIQAQEPGWKNAKLAQLWRSTLRTYCSPVFGSLPVESVDTNELMKVLSPIWVSKNETASRVRSRVENILDWARVQGHRTGENPARWRGHLDHLLAPRSKVAPVEHHPALPYTELPAFMGLLKNRPAMAARAFEFLILTASRTSEVLGATWDELNLGEALWTVPAARMKMPREHRVPLAPQAVELLKRLQAVNLGDYVFPSPVLEADKPLSNMALLTVLRRLDRQDITTHGFRSSFRDWVAEETEFPGEVAEAALAHAVGDKVEAAYRRGDLFEKRRKLMEAWADYVTQEPG